MCEPGRCYGARVGLAEQRALTGDQCGDQRAAATAARRCRRRHPRAQLGHALSRSVATAPENRYVATIPYERRHEHVAPRVPAHPIQLTGVAESSDAPQAPGEPHPFAR